MITEQYPISISYLGKVYHLPVRIDQHGSFYRISVDIEGREVCFGRDYEGGLRPLSYQDDFDPQFLYLVASAIQQQRLSYNLNLNYEARQYDGVY